MKRYLALLLALMLLGLCGCHLETGPSGSVPGAFSSVPPVSQSTPPSATLSSGPTIPAVPLLDPDGSYNSKEDVALFIHQYGHLPRNYVTKSESKSLGCPSYSRIEDYWPDGAIGGDRFMNREGLLPPGHTYYECDIDTWGKYDRGAKRIVFSTDGLVYYTDDHYRSFTLLYGELET